MTAFQNKIAIVTGGASGIGREMVLYLARSKAIVVIADIDEEGGEQVREQVEGLDSQAVFQKTDVSKREEVEKLIMTTRNSWGRIDLLINNAGVGLDGEFKDTTLDHWRWLLDINLWGVIYGTHLAYPLMIEQGYGQIVNVSSLAGLIPGGLMSSYNASKHAVVGLTLGLRAEARHYGVKVNALCPGFIETPIHDRTPKVSEFLKLEKNQRNKNRFPTADKCIKSMMRGIEKDRAIIISPWSHRFFWWLYRIFPSLIPLGWSRIIRSMKAPASG